MSLIEPPATKILVVDDDQLQRMIILRIATTMGFVVEEVAHLDEIPAALEASQPDLVLLDLSLGANDGIEVLHILTALPEPPAIMVMSGQDGRVRDVVRRYVRALGLRDMGELTKPINIASLKQQLAFVPKRASRIAKRRPDLELKMSDVLSAFRAGAIKPAYQPKVKMDTGIVTGVEALARCSSPLIGTVSPGVFCPMLDEAGLSFELTESVLRATCFDAAIWRRTSPDFTVSVNVSPVVIVDPRFHDMVLSALAENDLMPGALTLELLETASISGNHMQIACALTRLRIKGVGMAVDDFGTGYSSLASLHTLPFGELKIDASFVSACDRDRYAWNIVKASLAMAREFDMSPVAEGVETEAIRRRLVEAGCAVGQGFLFSPAVDAPNIANMLLAAPTTAAAGIRAFG
ncbi:MAG: response regulator receiver modulated diguanylate phosphodiesterase [Hyphomicrobiales bacterium]|nr:response regulator receiver modulated diguanylate phosphodiesterase [Hyphomicrobiales bacterium]